MALDVTITTPLSDTLQIVSLTGKEAISETFLFELELSSINAGIVFTQILGQPVALTFHLPTGDTQYTHGIVTAFRQGAQSGDGSVSYLARIEPWTALLRMNVQQRIFQNQSVPDILKAVFSALSLTDFKDSLTGTYTAREYCVQYNETTFDFISRLMESEGIFYFFTHTASAHTLVLADDAAAFTTLPGVTNITFDVTQRSWEMSDVLTEGNLEQRLVPSQVSADDFNFVTPTTDLYSITQGTGSGTFASVLSVHRYPGVFQAKNDGETSTGIALTSLEAEQQSFTGRSNCRAFHSGGKFTLAGHYRTDANTSYVLRSIEHNYQASEDSYNNAFTAFPSSRTFRPPQSTPRAVIRGVQTALVVGKAGEEIWTDQYGRVKVKFHWDQSSAQDETSSCWIRVAQGWAGQQWGSIFIPRVGQEVIVQFLDGDPDRPLITGAVYNGQQTVPYTLPDQQTKSTIKSSSSKGNSGYNELRFEDKAGSEEIFVQAQKDLNVTVLNNHTSTITKDRAVTVSQGNRTVAVTQGNETHTVGGKRDLTITGDESHTNSAKFTHTVSGDYSLSISGNLSISVSGSVSITSGTSFTNQAGTSLVNKAATSLTNQAGSSLSLTSDGTLSANGTASASVQSSGVLQIKGAMVQIN
jgi:type VI secretion system secreted protein VgrG